eukprot:16559-Heterococcus_DN1.PRE.1
MRQHCCSCRLTGSCLHAPVCVLNRVCHRSRGSLIYRQSTFSILRDSHTNETNKSHSSASSSCIDQAAALTKQQQEKPTQEYLVIFVQRTGKGQTDI